MPEEINYDEPKRIFGSNRTKQKSVLKSPTPQDNKAATTVHNLVAHRLSKILDHSNGSIYRKHLEKTLRAVLDILTLYDSELEIDADVEVKNSLTVDSDATVTGDISADNANITTDVSAGGSISGNALNATTDLIVGNDADITGDLIVGNDADITGDLDADNITGTTISVDGMTRIRAYQSSTQTLPTSPTFTKILFQTKDFDTLGEFSSSRFTCTKKGYYHIHVHWKINSISLDKYLIAAIYKNGGSISVDTAPSGSGNYDAEVSGTFYLYVDDYIEIYGTHSHGSDRDTIAGATATFIEIVALP